MKKIISILALMSTSAVCAAADWQLASESSTGDTLYVDITSVAPIGAHRKAWVQVNHSTPQETTGYPKKKYQSSRLLYVFDCRSRMIGTTQTVRYEEKFAGGQVVESDSAKFNPQNLTDVVPDTVGETLLQTACGSDSDRAKLKAKNQAKVLELIKQLKEFQKQENVVTPQNDAEQGAAAGRAAKAARDSAQEL